MAHYLVSALQNPRKKNRLIKERTTTKLVLFNACPQHRLDTDCILHVIASLIFVFPIDRYIIQFMWLPLLFLPTFPSLHVSMFPLISSELFINLIRYLPDSDSGRCQQQWMSLD